MEGDDDSSSSSSDEEVGETIWQKPFLYNKHLPYYQKLCEEANDHLARIKAGMGCAILLHEVHPGLSHWIQQLRTYINNYGKRFTKQDHVRFIHTLFELLIMPGQDVILMTEAAELLCWLLSDRQLLTREDLVLDWRPLYELYNYFVFKNLEEDGLICLPSNLKEILKRVVALSCAYFSDNSTKEILAETRPYMCPWDMSFLRAFGVFNLLLPTTVDPSVGFQLWLDELMTWWIKFRNCPPWEEVIVEIFARLAKDNIGLVNWEPYMQLIFTRFVRSLALTIGGSSDEIAVGSTTKNMSVGSACLWIASMLGGDSSTQAYITRLFQALESYYHPSNSANERIMQLLSGLPLAVCNRVHTERHKKHDWISRRVPEKARLTDADLEAFVKSMLPCALTAMFTKVKQDDATGCLRFLSHLCPKVVVDPVLERMLSSTETLVEPHRLLQSMNATIAVVLPLVREHRAHVVPLLSSLLPGFDLNDMVKCKIVCQILSLVALMVPVVDCSEAVHQCDNLTPEENELCSATAMLEGIVEQVFDRMFEIISVIGHTVHRTSHKEKIRLNVEELTAKAGFASVARALMNNCSTAIFDLLSNKIYNFVLDNVFDNRVAAEVTGELIWSVTKANPEKGLAMFFPYLAKKVLGFITDETLQEEDVSETLMWYMILLSHVVRAEGDHLIKYAHRLTEVIRLTLKLKNKDAYQVAGRILERTLTVMTTIYVSPSCVRNRESWDADFTKYLPIRHWGDSCSGRPEDLKVHWHIPSQAEIDYAVKLLEEFLLQQIDILNKPEATTAETMLRSLTISRACIMGSGALIPPFPPPFSSLIESRVEQCRKLPVVDVDNRKIELRGQNIRVIMHSALKTSLTFLMSKRPDDTKSLNHIAKDFHVLHIFRGYYDTRLHEQSKAIARAKKLLVDKTRGRKSYIRPLVEELCVFHHLKRANHRAPFYFTQHHVDILQDLSVLGTSHYGEVRRAAQEVLQVAFSTYPYSFRQILDKVVGFLKDDPAVSHDQFKGALYIILSGKRPVMPRDFSLLEQIWVALIKAQHDQKPSIVMLTDLIMLGVVENFSSYMVRAKVTPKVEAHGRSFWSAETMSPIKAKDSAKDSAEPPLPVSGGQPRPMSPSVPGASSEVMPARPMPSEEEMAKAHAACEEENVKRVNDYNHLVDAMVELCHDTLLHWRHKTMALSFISLQVRPDMPVGPSAIKLFTDHLVSETVKDRKLSVGYLGAVMKLQKRPTVKVPLHIETKGKWGYREDNDWLQYRPSTVPSTEAEWDASHLVDKTHWGFHSWPKTLEVPAPYKDQPAANRDTAQLPENEQPIQAALLDSVFVNRLCDLFSLEASKRASDTESETEDEDDNDEFHPFTFNFFKRMAQNFGDKVLEHFLPRMPAFAASNKVCEQKFLAEFIAGVVQGSKRWSFPMLTKLWSWVIPTLEVALDNVTSETKRNWGTCIATIFDSRDPRRLHQLVQLLFSIAEKSCSLPESSFLMSTKLYLLQGGLNQMEWRVIESLQRLKALCLRQIAQPYQNVRVRLGSCLSTVFWYHLEGIGVEKLAAPAATELTELVLSKIAALMEDKINYFEAQNGVSADIDEEKHKQARLILKTFLGYLDNHQTYHADTLPETFMQFLPVVCYLANDLTDDELKGACQSALLLMAMAEVDSAALPALLKWCDKLSSARWWKARLSVMAFLQVHVMSNLFQYTPEHIGTLSRLLMRMLRDEQIEVQAAASESLSGFLQCKLVNYDKKLDRTFETVASNKGLSLTERHGGVLGLAAIIGAYPYTVPPELVDTLMALSKHAHDPLPIMRTVKKTLAEFKRTHQDTWHETKHVFTDDQLAVLTDLLVSPNYYV